MEQFRPLKRIRCMARIARVVVPGLPHHVTQRGNRRQTTFFNDADYRLYLELLSEWSAAKGIDVWSYCLMPNHIHLIAIPRERESLRRCLTEVHRRYTRHVNFREDWRGHLWQGRFSSFPMDERHLLAAARYIERNPVSAGMVEDPKDYPWSSARAHLSGKDDGIVNTAPLLALVPDWRAFLNVPVDESVSEALLAHESTGRPLGAESFVSGIETLLDRSLRKQEVGRPVEKQLRRETGPMISIVSPIFRNN